MGTVFNIQRFCLNDGPGIRTTVFLKGCPLNCLWCHNPESKSKNPEILYQPSKCVGCGACITVCPEGCQQIKDDSHIFDRKNCILCGKCVEACPASALEMAGKEMSAKEVLDVVEKDKSFYGDEGGMTVSGGEPFYQFDFLMELISEAKERDIKVCIETSGYTTEENIKKAAPYVDFFLYDFKETDKESHKNWTGAENTLILSNLKALNDIGAKIILRTPIIPGYNARDEHFEKIGELSKTFKNIKKVDVEPYHPLGASKSESLGVIYQLKDLEFPKDEAVKEWVEKIGKNASRPVQKA